MNIIYNHKSKLFGLADLSRIIIEPCFESIYKSDLGYSCVKKCLWYKLMKEYGHYSFESDHNNLKSQTYNPILFEEVFINEWVFLNSDGQKKNHKRLVVIEPFNYGLAISTVISNNFNEELFNYPDIMINEEGKIICDGNKISSEILPNNKSFISYSISRRNFNEVCISGESYTPGKAADSKEDSYIYTYDIYGKFKSI